MTANRQRGEVSLDVGGISYTFVQSFNGMIDAEDASEGIFGERRAWDAIEAGVNAGGLRDLRLYMWGLLRKHHPGLTVEEVGGLVDAVGGLNALRATLEATVNGAAADPKDLDALGVGKNGRPRKARIGGTGARSTSSRVALA